MGAMTAVAIIGGAAYVGGQIYSAYAANEGANAQAEGAERAAAIAAAASEQNARVAARAAERSAEIQADAMMRGAAMQTQAMRDIQAMQNEMAARQMEQAMRFGFREELRAVTGQAATDSFQKVAGAFMVWTQTNDIAEEQRMRQQFGLENDLRFASPTPQPNTWDMQTTDLLTGQRSVDDNPYLLEGDRSLNDGVPGLDGTPPLPEPGSAWDGPIDLGNTDDLREGDQLAAEAEQLLGVNGRSR